ncbi:voltage-gated potassium channel [Phocoenobacter uteri]|uniref:Voltage-gated potassium channel n=1 Tax=Phocoenobacter uteri TaxID=146806 RepID=A0A379CA38_9PAST|nr:potassium channel family protein [Phocoenobacter uteri]MDG6882399.1 hypothetical protein [Phocoenobacter uteri]SUB58556.1 voltage-gated potassium channel [Phocoenobacter uteri]
MILLFKILFQGFKTDKEFQFLFVFIILLLIGANIFYTTIEGWSIIDALYFSVMTMATIGYGDLTPTTDVSKIFTIIYAFISIGTFVAFTAKYVQIMLMNHQSRQKLFSKNQP